MMETYPEMNEQIVEMLRLDASHNPAAKLYAAQRIEELERQLANAILTVHIHEKSLNEYAQTVYRLRKELEAKQQQPRVAPAWLRRYEEVE